MIEDHHVAWRARPRPRDVSAALRGALAALLGPVARKGRT